MNDITSLLNAIEFSCAVEPPDRLTAELQVDGYGAYLSTRNYFSRADVVLSPDDCEKLAVWLTQAASIARNANKKTEG